jgi:putative FmdB family regulatory protein
MPDYVCRCSKCGGSFVEHQSLQEHLQGKGARCPHCQSTKVERTMAAVRVETSRKT